MHFYVNSFTWIQGNLLLLSNHVKCFINLTEREDFEILSHLKNDIRYKFSSYQDMRKNIFTTEIKTHSKALILFRGKIRDMR